MCLTLAYRSLIVPVACSYAINARRGNFFMHTSESRGHLQKKRRGKEKRGEDERGGGGVALEDYFWRWLVPRPKLG